MNGLESLLMVESNLFANSSVEWSLPYGSVVVRVQQCHT
jgi:hypothetical protein